ncbi:hypothetical protein DL96DRAFT_1594801 [Flagelloscypha sp. PMI_526]|nr:hypothetical protein DL96DRAFT_1594801 [Flagelloscypha sp. PMI_526]
MTISSSVHDYYGERSPEAQAHIRFTEVDYPLVSDPSYDEALIALTASYRSLERYLTSPDDLYILPRSVSEVRSILRRYAYDAIHNIVSSNSNSIRSNGGYSRICNIAETSINNVLSIERNAELLLAVHTPPAARPETPTASERNTHETPWFIRTA